GVLLVSSIVMLGTAVVVTEGAACATWRDACTEECELPSHTMALTMSVRTAKAQVPATMRRRADAVWAVVVVSMAPPVVGNLRLTAWAARASGNERLGTVIGTSIRGDV